jgi:hypothetical protein
VSQPADQDSLRIGTQEREDAIRVLGEHFAAGRLPMDEYEQRVSGAIDSQNRGQLRTLFDDLPAPYPPFMAPPPAPLVAVPMYPASYPLPVMYSDKSRVAAGVLQLVFPFGVGRFYTGHTGMAVAQLITALFFVGIVWSFIDGIILLTSGGTDAEGRRLRDA